MDTKKGRLLSKSPKDNHNFCLALSSKALNVFRPIHAEGVASGLAHAVHENTLLGRSRPVLVLDSTPLVLNSGRLTLGQVVGVETANLMLVLRSDENRGSRVSLSVRVTEINLLHSLPLGWVRATLPTLCYSPRGAGSALLR